MCALIFSGISGTEQASIVSAQTTTELVKWRHPHQANVLPFKSVTQENCKHRKCLWILLGMVLARLQRVQHTIVREAAKVSLSSDPKRAEK